MIFLHERIELFTFKMAEIKKKLMQTSNFITLIIYYKKFCTIKFMCPRFFKNRLFYFEDVVA